MDWLASGTYVRLRSRLKGTYLHADENGLSVSLTADRASLNTAWRVEPVRFRYLRARGNYFSLQGAAYGRYLAVSPQNAQRGHGYFLRQNIFYGEKDHVDAAWLALKVWGAASDEYLMRHCRYSAWHIGVTGESFNDLCTHWIVEVIPLRVQPPALPYPVEEQEHPNRKIVYALTDNHGGMIHPTSWRAMDFSGRSVHKLRDEVAHLLGEENSSHITLYAWTGYYCPRIPLVVDLPSDTDTIVIVVLSTGSATLRLSHPDVDAP